MRNDGLIVQNTVNQHTKENKQKKTVYVIKELIN